MNTQWISDVQAFFFSEITDSLSRARLFAAHMDDVSAEAEARLVFQSSDMAMLMLPALQDSYDAENDGHRLLWTLREIVEFTGSPRQKTRAQELIDRATTE